MVTQEAQCNTGVYEQKDDGTLVPINAPSALAKKVHLYLWLKRKDLSLEEIKYITSEFQLL